MPITLVALTPADLRHLAESPISEGRSSTALEGALPPAVAVRRSREQLAAGKPERWCTVYAMVRLADGLRVGSCGFKDVPVNGRVEIGYGVALSCRNTGVASAAVAALLDMAFASGLVREVLAQVSAENKPSTRVVEKLGFRWLGTKADADGENLVQWVATRAAIGSMRTRDEDHRPDPRSAHEGRQGDPP